MKEKDILSKNPAGSGGVGLSKVLVDRAMGPCSCGAAPDAEVDEPTKKISGTCDKTLFKYTSDDSPLYNEVNFYAKQCVGGSDCPNGKYTYSSTDKANGVYVYTKQSARDGYSDIIWLRVAYHPDVKYYMRVRTVWYKDTYDDWISDQGYNSDPLPLEGGEVEWTDEWAWGATLRGCS
jgi:hypothetical protein